MSNLIKAIVIGVFLVAFILRLPGLGSFLTVDEVNWIMRSADFWHAIWRDHDIAATFLTTHPGTTLNWISGASLAVQEGRLGFDVDSSNIEHFKKAARLPVVVTISVLIAWLAWLTTKLFGLRVGLLTGVFLAAEPYLVGMGQVVHLDMLLGLFMLSSFFSWIFALKEKSWRWALIAAISAGLAFSTKLMPALWLGPSLLIISMLSLKRREISWQWLLQRSVSAAAVAIILFVIMWPAVLTKADFQLGYISRDAQTVVTDEHVQIQAPEGDPIVPASFYLRTIMARTSPLTLLLVATALILLLRSAKKLKYKLSPDSEYALVLLLYALGFIALITLAAKKADRYAVPALITFPIISAWAITKISRAWRGRLALYSFTAIAGSLILVTISWAPYAIAYNNSIFANVRPLSQQGWGEGLDEAAAWLNEHPLGDKLTIASWYPSVTRAFFNGPTFHLSSRNDYRVGYIVTYRNMGGRAGDSQASDVLDELKNQEPVHTVYIKDKPYAWIYETDNVGNFIKHIGELTSGVAVGQTVKPDQDNWSSIDIGFATFSDRDNTADVVLNIYKNPETTDLLRSVAVNASEIQDNLWQEFSFQPIENSANQEFYVSITSPNSRPGNAVTVRYTDENLIEGQMYLKTKAGTLEPKLGDIAYRIENN